uniref:CALCITONIN domain-containing protein n=1 Tax=Panagrellus redivivus TaxID=6233 RepID=A0A7E4V0F8_PANRE
MVKGCFNQVNVKRMGLGVVLQLLVMVVYFASMISFSNRRHRDSKLQMKLDSLPTSQMAVSPMKASPDQLHAFLHSMKPINKSNLSAIGVVLRLLVMPSPSAGATIFSNRQSERLLAPLIADCRDGCMITDETSHLADSSYYTNPLDRVPSVSRGMRKIRQKLNTANSTIKSPEGQSLTFKKLIPPVFVAWYR